jgi:hypothetical protein
MKRAYLLIAAMVTMLMSGQARATNDEACPEVVMNQEVANAGGIAPASGDSYTPIEVHQGGQDGGGALW